MNTCLHCGETFANPLTDAIGSIVNYGKEFPYIGNIKPYTIIGSVMIEEQMITFYLVSGRCHKCDKPSIIIQSFKYNPVRQGYYEKMNQDLFSEISIYPLHNEIPVSKEVPAPIADDYKQATRISSLSTKASATLARRCLQATLRNKFPEMGKKPNLKQEIDWVIENGNLEDEINEVLHKLRDAGNFGAHPSEDGLTEIYDLSQEDLEACFLLLDHLFDIFYVQPAKRKEKLSKLKNIPNSKK